MLDKISQTIPYIEKAASKFISPIKIDIEKLYYDFFENSASSSLVIIEIHPSKYWLDVMLTNTSSTAVFLKSIVLTINKNDYIPTEDIAGTRLEPGELVKKTYIFSVSRTEGVGEGRYELSVIPATGKTAIAKGDFPIKK